MASSPPGLTPTSATLGGDIGWTSPTLLEAQTPQNANLGGIALAPNGTGMIVYEHDGVRATIMATQFLPGAGAGGTDWEVPTLISHGVCNNYAPRVAMDASGQAMVVWNNKCNNEIDASLFTPGLGWKYFGYVDFTTTASTDPQVAMNANGTAFVIWAAHFNGQIHPYANHYVPGVGWGAAIEMDFGTNNTQAYSVAVDGSGDAIVSWLEQNTTGWHVMARRFSGGVWGVRTPLESSLTGSAAPALAMDGHGNAVVAWIQGDTPYDVWANRYDHSTGWTGAVKIESQPFWADTYPGPQVAANNGSAVVVWSMAGSLSDTVSVWANAYVAGVGWKTESDIDQIGGTNYIANFGAVALDATGNASIVYRVEDTVATPQPLYLIYAIRYEIYPASEQALWVLDYYRTTDGAPLVALDTAGNALAAWTYNENSVTPTILGIASNRYTPSGGWRWYGPQQAEWDENLYPNWLQLEANAAGDAIYSWTQNDGPISQGYADLYTPSTGWSLPTLIQNMTYSSVAEEWSAIDGQGNALVLFKTSNGSQYNVYATYYSVRTGWGSPHRVDSASGSAKTWLRVALNRNGDGVATWLEWNGVQYNDYAAFFNGTTQTWGAPMVIQSEFAYVYSSTIALDGKGNAMDVYLVWNGTGYANYASYYRPGAGWGAPVQIQRAYSSFAYVYALESNDAGDFAASWGEWDGNHTRAAVNLYTPATGWESPETFVSPSTGDAGPATPSLDGAGDALVVYNIFDGTQYDVYGVTRAAGGTWGMPVRLNSGMGDAIQQTSSLSYSGDGYASWTQYNGNGYDIVARRYVAGQGWLPPTAINAAAPATSATDAGNSNLAVDGHGNAIVGWNQWHQGVLVPYAVEYIVGSGAPDLVVNSPADGAVTNQVTVTVSGTTDPGASVTINGAALSVAADGSFSRAYSLTDGTHTFTAIATGAAGLSTTATRTITVDTTAPALSLTAPSNGLLTRTSVVQVTGTTEAGASVVVNGVDAAVSSTGQFSVAISLHEGANMIVATATDPAGNQAQASVSVTLDTTPPAISITSPASGANLTVPTVTVTGTTEPGATVIVNDHSVTVDASGSFTAQISLGEGANLIIATATDAAGNSASAQVAVTYTNPAPAAQVQANLASLNTMELVLLVLVIVSLGLAGVEIVMIRRLRAQGGKPPQKPEEL